MEFRPTNTYQSYRGGRSLQIIDPTSLSSVNRVYVGRSSQDDFPYRHFGGNHHHHHHHHHHKPNKLASAKSSSKGFWNSKELKRKKRVAKYKFYAAEGKVKASIKKGFRWIKLQCSKIIGIA